MNFGANVPPGLLLRTEAERRRVESLLLKADMPRSASELLRECVVGEMGDIGDGVILDFDRACPGGGPGEGVP